MKYCLINSDGVITNIIVALEEYAATQSNMYPILPGLHIGDKYPTMQNLFTENIQLKNKLEAVIKSNEMLENCLVEMAGVVYA